MEIKSLGHVVVRVKNIQESESFYHDVLGLPVCAHYQQDGLNMAFFTLGNHHDFAISESPELGNESASGLDHVAFKIGDSIEDLVDAKRWMEEHGIDVMPIDHNVTKSIYISDPDGNGIELYIDSADTWRQQPELIAHAEPLEI
jgi:catechol 2,3-dioxygenase